MPRENILLFRRGQLKNICEELDLAGILFCRAVRDRYDTWLSDDEEIPVLEPFGRLNLFWVSKEGEVTPFCAYENHPCDFPHYPLFDASLLRIKDPCRVGIVNPGRMLEITHEQLINVYPNISYIDVTDKVQLARARKCRQEQEGIADAASRYQRLFSMIPLIFQPYRPVFQAVADLRRRAAQAGAEVSMMSEDPMAITLVHMNIFTRSSSNGNCNYPGHILEKGDGINICVNGYLRGGFSAALGRCFTLGRASDILRSYWDLTIKAQDYLADHIHAGGTIGSAVEKFREEFLIPNHLKGETENCIYGIGCGRSEAPRSVDWSRKMILEEGMTLVVAPVIQLPDGKELCCMDVYCLDGSKCVRLGSTERGLVEIM